MWARMTRLSNVSSEQFDAGLEWVDSTMGPALHGMDGFEGILVMGSPDRDASVVVSLWSSREALDASTAAADALRADGAQAMAGVIAAVDVLEVHRLHVHG